MHKQIGILALLATVRISGALLATPSLKVTNAQANDTKTLDVDKWIVVLKEAHPSLAAIEQAQDVKDVITKIKAMEAKEAVKDLLALHILYDLQELKRLKHNNLNSTFFINLVLFPYPINTLAGPYSCQYSYPSFPTSKKVPKQIQTKST